MMSIEKDVSLRKYNTFGVEAKTLFFTDVDSVEALSSALQQKDQYLPLLILGGGSNILLTRDFEGLTMRINLKGISVVRENPKEVFVKVMAGENWEDFVKYSIENDWGGVENLTLIPGNTGTAPMQNIGAYGVEIKDVFHTLEALEIQTGHVSVFSREQCRFGYRDSYFKQEGKNKFIILSVTFRLTKTDHILNTGYAGIDQEIKSLGLTSPTIADIANIIRKIRKSKLPDPQLTGNAGSFFKNPVVGNKTLSQLKKLFPDIPYFTIDHEKVKIPAAFLIEQAGWKGFRRGDAGVHHKQPLVLINYGQATGKEILQLAQEIVDHIHGKFNIQLEKEVNVI
ncbi:MAG: UDP-N-acetylmuramate dehydrogenase [Bacteroidota bacterium]